MDGNAGRGMTCLGFKMCEGRGCHDYAQPTYSEPALSWVGDPVHGVPVVNDTAGEVVLAGAGRLTG